MSLRGVTSGKRYMRIRVMDVEVLLRSPKARLGNVFNFGFYFARKQGELARAGK